VPGCTAGQDFPGCGYTGSPRCATRTEFDGQADLDEATGKTTIGLTGTKE